MPRQGLQVQYPTKRILDIQPVLGMVTAAGPEIIPLGASPEMRNFCLREGILCKRPGYTKLISDGVGGSVIGMLSSQTVAGTLNLHVVWADGVKRLNGTTWTTVTGTALTGPDTTLCSIIPSQTGIVFSQGVNGVYLINVSADTYATLSANCPPAKYLERFADRLILGYTYESSAWCPYRLRRSVSGDHTDWTGIGSGFRDAADAPFVLQNIRRLGNYLAVYYEQAIEVAARTGIAAAPLQYETRIEGTGLLAPFTLTGHRGVHRFLGTDDFYEFDGSTLRPIGAVIRDTVFPNLSAVYTPYSWGLNLLNSQEYIAATSYGTYSPLWAWVYNWGRQVWYPWSISGHQCATTHRLLTGPTINELSGTIDQQNWAFDSAAWAPTDGFMLTGGSNGYVYRWGNVYTSDDGTAFTCTWSSRDITALDIDPLAFNQQITIRRLLFVMKSTGTYMTLNVKFSIDGGHSWMGPYTGYSSPVNAPWTEIKIDRMVTGDKIRFQFYNDSSSEAIGVERILVVCELRGELRQ